jgi:hypothetical protein
VVLAFKHLGTALWFFIFTAKKKQTTNQNKKQSAVGAGES